MTYKITKPFQAYKVITELKISKNAKSINILVAYPNTKEAIEYIRQLQDAFFNYQQSFVTDCTSIGFSIVKTLKIKKIFVYFGHV